MDTHTICRLSHSLQSQSQWAGTVVYELVCVCMGVMCVNNMVCVRVVCVYGFFVCVCVCVYTESLVLVCVE